MLPSSYQILPILTYKMPDRQLQKNIYNPISLYQIKYNKKQAKLIRFLQSISLHQSYWQFDNYVQSTNFLNLGGVVSL